MMRKMLGLLVHGSRGREGAGSNGDGGEEKEVGFINLCKD
jgi:hypothetical protein